MTFSIDLGRFLLRDAVYARLPFWSTQPSYTKFISSWDPKAKAVDTGRQSHPVPKPQDAHYDWTD